MQRTRKDIDAKVGARVKAARLSRKLTFEQVADHLTISNSEYGALETGLKRFLPSQLIEISRLLEVNVYDFFETPQIAPAAKSTFGDLAQVKSIH